MKSWVAQVSGRRHLGAFSLTRLSWEEDAPSIQLGQFLLVRPVQSWDPYLRWVVFPVLQDEQAGWWVYPARPSALAFLPRIAEGTPCPTWGPRGQGFPRVPKGAHVVVLIAERQVPYLLGVITHSAATADVVCLLVREADASLLPNGWSWLPASVEVTAIPSTPERLQAALAELLPWADYVFACGAADWPPQLRRAWETTRGALPQGRIFVLLPHGLVCGLGLCDACCIPTPRGTLRACRQGPVIDVGRWWSHG